MWVIWSYADPWRTVVVLFNPYLEIFQSILNFSNESDSIVFLLTASQILILKQILR